VYFVFYKCIGGISESICKFLHSKFICIASMRKKCICIVVAAYFEVYLNINKGVRESIGFFYKFFISASVESLRVFVSVYIVSLFV
jgi:hypothetical protein